MAMNVISLGVRIIEVQLTEDALYNFVLSYLID